MIALRKGSHLGVTISVAAGIVLALLLCFQCVRTYLYVGNILVPQEAEREAERQVGAVASAARSAGVADARALGPVLEQIVEESSGQVIWLRLLNPESEVLAQAGAPLGEAKVPSKWWEVVQKRDPSAHRVETPSGAAFVSMLPYRSPRPPRVGRPDGQGRPPEAGDQPRGESAQRAGDQQVRAPQSGPRAEGDPPRAGGGRAGAFAMEVAIRLDAASEVFSGLRQNLVSGMVASLALLAALAVILLRAPHYLRGKYLEKELDLARLVQSDLLPKPVAVSPHIDFAAAATAADSVGGDFHDVFETDSGRVAIVLGDVSGKGVSAALLVSVIQGAIRCASGSQPETSCERINRMLCEKTASERFATMFWGTFDPLTATLRYVNAGHAAPLLLRANSQPGAAPERLAEGGPVLGLLPEARYSCGKLQVGAGDTLVVYSDGLNEAVNTENEEFGDDRILQIVSQASASTAQEICGKIAGQVTAFASATAVQDDRTLLVVRFLKSRAAMTA